MGVRTDLVTKDRDTKQAGKAQLCRPIYLFRLGSGYWTGTYPASVGLSVSMPYCVAKNEPFELSSLYQAPADGR